MVAQDIGKRLVSGALYRGGFIARVRRQALAGDTPIHQRDDLTRYPEIPAGDDSRRPSFSSPPGRSPVTPNRALEGKVRS